MGKVVSVRNQKSYLGCTGNQICPNLYAVTEKTGVFSTTSYWYCTATKKSLDNGYKQNVCNWVGDKKRNVSCNCYDGRIYPY